MEIHVVLSAIGAIVAAVVASNKHRNVIGWSVFGLLLPVIAVIAVCCVGPVQHAMQPQHRT